MEGGYQSTVTSDIDKCRIVVFKPPLPSESSHGRFSPNTKIHANHPVISLLYLTNRERVFLILEREADKVDGCPTATTIITDSSRVVTLDFNNPTNPKSKIPPSNIRTRRSASAMSRCKVRGENHGY
ncbi:hypothetical protein AAC387_Pa02g0576 [Persea americana]